MDIGKKRGFPYTLAGLLSNVNTVNKVKVVKCVAGRVAGEAGKGTLGRSNHGKANTT